MQIMFACSKCGSVYQLPKCIFCGNKVACTEDIWQLTDDPDIVTSGDGDKYIGYEYIGKLFRQ